MNHCLEKQRHRWEDKYGMLTECSVCHKTKTYKTTQKGRKHAKGAFGRQGI